MGDESVGADCIRDRPGMGSRLKTASTTTRICLAVFAVALAVRLLTLTFWLPRLRPDVDLDSYRSLAQHVAAGKGFVAISDAGQELPNVSRTPVYPLFLAALMRVGGDKLGLFLAVQCVLGAVACLLTVMLASRWLSWAGATVAGLVVAVDPNSIVRCVDLRTETLFTLLLIGGACVLTWRDKQWWGWVLGGFLWSLAALCRPIAVWLWVVALILAFTTRASWPKRFSYLALFLIVYLPLEGVWAARNMRLTGRCFVSTIATYNLLMYRTAGVEAERTRQPLEVVQRRFLTDFGDIQFFDGRAAFDSKLQTYKRTAARILSSATALVAKQTIVGWVKVLFGPGARSIDNMLREPGSPPRWWPPLYTLGLIVAALLSLVGVIKLGREATMMCAVALYLVLLAGGPESNSRFRVPMTPVLAILAVAGAVSVCSREASSRQNPKNGEARE
jgi:hypothetical protein